jgi:hypothetical protein
LLICRGYADKMSVRDERTMGLLLDRFRFVNCVHQRERDLLKDFLGELRFQIFELDGAYIENKTTFLEAVNKQWPRTKELGGYGWDQWNSVFGAGLEDLESERVALIWYYPEHLINGDLPSFLIAYELLWQMAQLAITEPEQFSHMRTLLIFLVGNGDNFPPFSSLLK